ncbi:hypothetical protein [Luteibacter sp. HA06]
MESIAVPSKLPPLSLPGLPHLVADVFDVFVPDVTDPKRHVRDALLLFAVRISNSTRYIGRSFREESEAIGYLKAVAELESAKQLAHLAQLQSREVALENLLRGESMRRADSAESVAVIASANGLPTPAISVGGTASRLRNRRASALVPPVARTKDPGGPKV